jgi:hypothetical protein
MAKTAERLSKAFETGMQKGSASQEEEKFLGFIPLPPGVATGLMTVWTTAIASYSDHISGFIYRHGHQVATEHLKIKEGKPLTTGLTIAANSVVLIGSAAPSITKFFDTHKQQHKQLVETAKRVAPVLNEIRGKHGIGAFASIGIETNEVIYAHRRRINDKAGIEYGNHFVGLLSQAPLLAKQFLRKGNYQTIAEVKEHKELEDNLAVLKKEMDSAQDEYRKAYRAGAEDEKRLKIAAKEAEYDYNNAKDELKLKDEQLRNAGKHTNGSAPNLGPTELITAGLTPILGAFQSQNEKRFKDKMPEGTALDMILDLERQIAADAKSATFQFPKGSVKGKSSAQLTEYIVEVIKHHQLDMEALDVEYVPIRQALENQLHDIAAPIAEAIQKGDLSTLALVRLVGEGHIIKNKGRSLAKPSEVKALLEKMGASTTAYTQVDPKEYFADAAFNKKELKEALDALQGDEKLHFATLFPDAVLHEVGMSEQDVKALRAATVKTYEADLGKAILGLAAEEDKALHDIGLAKEEVRELREIAQKIKEQGEAAVHEVAAKPNNPIGFERVVASAAITKIIGGETGYMGKLISQASAVAKTDAGTAVSTAEDAEQDADKPAKSHAAKHVKASAHAEREEQRRDHGFEQHEVSA